MSMSFTELNFIPFLVVTLTLNYLFPPKYRYIVIFAASYYFYGLGDISIVKVLVIVTALTYIGGLILEKYKKKSIFRVFFWANLGILFVLKYSNFALGWMNFFATKAGCSIFTGKTIDLLAPIGLSFYVFQSTNYLNDVYRKGLVAEKNPIRYAAYVSFFPVILSGPIQKSRELLPQLKEPDAFNAEYFIRSFMLFLWGFLEKVFVSGKLKVIVDTCWSNWNTHTGVYPIIAAIAFSFYIYCDFSAYSDMACGISRMLGFRVRNNFRNPYMATSLTEFWNRWHMSLNDWFVENVYIPLGGNRKGKLRKYINVMLVFLFSGAWHGASMHFVILGLANGLLQIAGQILAPFKKRVYSLIGVDDRCFSIRMLKRAGVFFFITLTWLFFRAPGTSAALSVIRSIFMTRPVDFFNPDLFMICGSVTKTFLCIVALTIFITVQIHRKDTSKYYSSFRAQPILFQTLFAGFMILVIVMASVAGWAEINTQFIYFQF